MRRERDMFLIDDHDNLLGLNRWTHKADIQEAGFIVRGEGLSPGCCELKASGRGSLRRCHGDQRLLSGFAGLSEA